MYELNRFKNPNEKDERFRVLNSGVLKLGGIVELVVVLVVWLWLFQESKNVGGYSEAEIVTYILGGSFISVFTGWVLSKMIRQDIIKKESKMFVYKPLRYLGHLLVHGWAKVLLPFILAVGLHLGLLLFFQKEIIININLLDWLMIGIMIALSFIIEFFFAYFINLNIFWTIESEGMYRLLTRIKKILSGAYFPLSIFPSLAVYLILFLPFAYSFYVPAQIYLGRFGFDEAVRGVFIQMSWIVILYVGIKFAWTRNQLKIKN
jgi:ABC-2 type transport system permease protein